MLLAHCWYKKDAQLGTSIREIILRKNEINEEPTTPLQHKVTV